jgi:hypothetical protein
MTLNLNLENTAKTLFSLIFFYSDDLQAAETLAQATAALENAESTSN